MRPAPGGPGPKRLPPSRRVLLDDLVPSGRVEGGHLKSIRSGTKVPSSPQIGERSIVTLPAITSLASTPCDRQYRRKLAACARRYRSASSTFTSLTVTSLNDEKGASFASPPGCPDRR